MKTLIGFFKHTAANQNADSLINYTVYEVEHDRSFDVSREIPDLIENQTPLVTIRAPQMAHQAISEQIVTYFLENQLACKVNRFDFSTRSGAIGANLATTDNSTAIAVTLPGGTRIRGAEISNDFYDLLRKLDEVLLQISEHIRGINDPNILDARLKLVRASADSMRCYIDIANQAGPDEIPNSVGEELKANLGAVDWIKQSTELRAWAKIALELYDKLKELLGQTPPPSI